MRPADLYRDDFGGGPRFDTDLVESLRVGPPTGRNDIEVAVPLARVIHDELEAYGTDGNNIMTEHQMRVALRALSAVTERLGVNVDVPFRDFSTFRSWWIRNEARGSWQARRDLLHEVFEPIHDVLADLEDKALASSLVEPISPHPRTGWPAVDTEISELRRHFFAAQTPQDYRAVGLDCVAVTEALSGTVYRSERHLREGETEPPVDKTKQRLDRFIEDALEGSENAAIRKLARASIELAQEVKHRDTPTRRDAGVAADAVILLANILRRLDEPETPDS